jgi:GTP cyclohydrolase II
MQIPEIMADLEVDNEIVTPDGIKCIKAAIDHVWNLPALAATLGMDEVQMRAAIADSTENPRVNDMSINAYLPPIGGITMYFIGDPSKLADPSTEVAVRCHDACCGSDVFGTDICTCRPYLVYAIQGCVETAKRGGVGIIVYFRKEGRSLGEVVKFRVYNARKAQAGGDTAENYFRVTESIAGIRDARFQEMMPDALLWLGVKRIDWLLSMSSDKYDAIVSAGIQVMQRVALPSVYVPKGATVEITAKIAAGYHTETIESEEVMGDLRTLDSVRLRCTKVFQLAQKGKTHHFDVDLSKLPATVDLVIDVTKKNYPSLDAIPYHSRWRHLNPADLDPMVAKWPVDKKEQVRRLLDLATISVLLDAGAGKDWSYVTDDGRKVARSEGLAAASLDMFKDGIFSSDVALPHRVNSHGLKGLQLKQLQKGFQLSTHNPMVGLEGRFAILQRMGVALEAHPEFFGTEVPRPGNLVDYVLKNADASGNVSIRTLWKAVVEGFESIWPMQTQTTMSRGDMWVYTPLKIIGKPASDIVPFHKLSQWLTYSLLEPLESLGIHFTELNLMTGLAEYRNGGLFVDTGVLVLKKKDEVVSSLGRGGFDIGSELVVEWRALTVALLDLVAEGMRKKLNLTAEQLPLAKVLQGGTWAAGREIAKEKRADGSAPIPLRSDGTVF